MIDLKSVERLNLKLVRLHWKWSRLLLEIGLKRLGYVEMLMVVDLKKRFVSRLVWLGRFSTEEVKG